jgi:hypothetical protein
MSYIGTLLKGEILSFEKKTANHTYINITMKSEDTIEPYEHDKNIMA